MIWNFYKVLETLDYDFLKKGATEEDWMQLYDEYFQRSGMRMPDWKTLQKYQKLVMKEAVVTQVLEIVEKRDENAEEATKALAKWGYRFNGSQGFQWNVDRFKKSLEVLGTKIKIIGDDLPKEERELNLYRDLVYLKRNLKIDIDPKKTSCAEWIEMNKQLKEDVRSDRLTG